MKNIYFILISVWFLFLTACNSKKQDSTLSKTSTAQNLYFGHKPPGLIPEIFAPGIVSVKGRYEYAVSFSPNLDEIYFSGSKEDGIQTIYFSKLEDKKWSHPKKANFTKDKKRNEFKAFVCPDGDKIYFAAYNEPEDVEIFYINRLENSWSDAIQLDSPINDDKAFYSNTAKNGDIFYTNISKRKMYYAPNKNGKYPEVHEVDIEYGLQGFISPSQDFIVVNARNREDDKRKDQDIYICFKQQEGTWSKPINLGNVVNSDFTETSPSLTPDGKYLFFSRYNEEGGLSNIYWVSAEVIESIRPQQ